MKIRSLEIRGIGPYVGDTSTLELPETGVVTISGDNGAGKSTWIEALVGFWMTSLRGDFATTGANVHAHMHDGSEVRRDDHRNIFTVRGIGMSQLSTRTALRDRVIADHGPANAWVAAHVLDPDVPGFAASTDGERKSILEDLLGMTLFDAAHAAARTTLKSAQSVVLGLDPELIAAQRLRADRHARLDRLRARPVEADPPPPVWPAPPPAVERPTPEQLAAAAAALERARADQRAVEVELHEAISRSAAATQVGHGLAARVRALGTGDACPTCGGPSTGARASLTTQVVDAASASRTAAAAERGLRVRLVAAQEAVRLAIEASEKLGQAAQRADAADRQRQASASAEAEARRKHAEELEAVRARRVAAAAEIERAELELVEVSEELAQTKDRREAAARQQRVADAASSLLSPRGVRADLLASAVATMNALLATWLDRLRAMPFRIELVNDRITMTLPGAGRRGYRACSRGERRRVDIACMLAISDLASSCLGKPAGTLWVDEAFDSVDRGGLHRVVEIVESLAEHRCVVLISHSDALLRDVKAERRYEIARGADGAAVVTRSA